MGLVWVAVILSSELIAHSWEYEVAISPFFGDSSLAVWDFEIWCLALTLPCRSVVAGVGKDEL